MEIIRERYLEKIRPFINKQLIKVIVGQRRVGKSFLLRQIINEIKNLNPGASVIYIDKEKSKFDTITTGNKLLEYLQEYSGNAMNYLLIDEVQEIIGFEKALRSLLSEGNYDIYCTGSNSTVFSGEMATLLSGRQIEFQVYSLSYPEFIQFNNLKNNRESLMMYLKYGGLPYLMHLPKDDDIIYDYLKNIYATILFRDIISRKNIRDSAFLERLLKFIADNIGNIFSANSISDFLKSQKTSKTVSVIINYISYLEQAYFVHQVKRYDIRGKRIFESGEKYYFNDIGIRNVIGGNKPDDIGKIIENVVYNHLCFLGYHVFIGKDGNNEIDFIAEKQNEKLYFQVTLNLSGEKVVKREFGNLATINDNYPKYVISLDEIPITTTYEGIKYLDLLNFLQRSDY